MKCNVSAYRVYRGFSISQLADLCGVTVHTIADIENHNFVPSIRLAVLISHHLKVPLYMLFDFSDTIDDIADVFCAEVVYVEKD